MRYLLLCPSTIVLTPMARPGIEPTPVELHQTRGTFWSTLYRLSYTAVADTRLYLILTSFKPRSRARLYRHVTFPSYLVAHKKEMEKTKHLFYSENRVLGTLFLPPCHLSPQLTFHYAADIMSSLSSVNYYPTRSYQRLMAELCRGRLLHWFEKKMDDPNSLVLSEASTAT